MTSLSSVVKVSLSTAEVFEATRIAALRFYAGPNRPLEGTRQDLFTNEQRSCVAEWAVAKHFGVEPDRSIYRDRVEGRIADLVVGGLTVQVKCSEYRRPCLLVAEGDSFCERYVLVSAPDAAPAGQCTVLGWVDKRSLLQYQPRKFHSERFTHVVPWQELNPMSAWGRREEDESIVF